MSSPGEWYLVLEAWQICGLLFVLMAFNGFFSTPPSEVVFGIAGYLVSLDKVPLWAALLAGVGGDVAGTSLLFFLAGRWGERVVLWGLAFNPWLRDNLLAATRGAFSRHGSSIVLVGRCLPMVRSVVSIPAGLASMRWTRFLLLTTTGCLLWALLWGGAGYIVGEQTQGLIREMKYYSLALTGTIVALVFLWLYRQMRRYLDTAPPEEAPVDVPARFAPRDLATGLKGLWQLGEEIFFAPLTNFIRVQRISRDTPVERRRYSISSAIVSLGVQVFYMVVATLILGLVTRGEVPNRSQVVTGIRWGFWAFLGTLFVSIAWHVINNYRDVPEEYGRHFYVAVNRALNRGMVVAHSGFFIGVGVDLLLKSASSARLFQPALVAFSLCGLVIGVVLRLTLSIVHFEPLLLAKRPERFYVETRVKRRDFCRLLVASGAGLMLLALFFWNAGGSDPEGARGAEATFRFLWLAAGYLGLVAIVAGVLTAWGFVFPWSWLWHTWLLWQHSRGQIDAVTALRRSPLTYDELFLVPVPVRRLLLALVRERGAQGALPELFFVLTETYKIHSAARVIAELIDNGELPPERFLERLREQPQLSDAPPQIAFYLQASVSRTVFYSLDGPLSRGQLRDLRHTLEARHAGVPEAAILVSALQAWEDLLRVETLADWPWRPEIEEAPGDLLGLGSELRDLAQAKDLALRVSRRAPYQERAQALHQAIEILRQVRERLNPWLGALTTEALDRFLDHLYMAMHRVLLSADLEVYMLPVPLQAGIDQELVVTLTNHGPGRAQEVRVRLLAEGDIEAEAHDSEILAARERQQFALPVHPLRPGLLRGEIELSYRDDLLQERHQLQPVELTVQGKVEEFREFTNPFIVGAPLHDAELFFGRTSVLESFYRAPYPNILVTGPPRIGKTSLLYQMKRAAGERPCVLLDLQRYSSESDPERLSRRLAGAIDPSGSQDVIEVLGSFLGRRGHPVLLVDECGYLPILDTLLGGRLGAELRGALNALDCQVVLAGPLSIAGKEPSSPLAQLTLMLEQMRLGLLRPAECAMLLTRPLAGYLSALPGSISRFIPLTGGHPFVAQRLAHTITDKALERQQGLIDDALLDEAANGALALLEPLFRFFWSSLGSAHQDWLLEVAHGVPGNPPPDVALLQDLCLIASSRPGEWHIPIGLWERWLRQKFDLPTAGRRQGGRD